MARLRQQHAQNYPSAENINREFENIVRYLNSAEIGNKTLSELLSVMFNDGGEFDGPIEMRLNQSLGLQFRVGHHVEPEAGWQTIVSLAAIRGNAGQNFGLIGEAVMQQRQDYTATAAQVEFPYSHTSDDEMLVYREGLLISPTVDYTTSTTGGTGVGSFTILDPAADGEKFTAFLIRGSEVSGFGRVDIDVIGPQAVFPYPHSDSTRLFVYRNGILQRHGGTYDYINQPAQDTITTTDTVNGGERMTIMSFTLDDQPVTGMMLEEDYVDAPTGQILYSKIAIEDEGIPQAKVAGLVSRLGETPHYFVQGTTPVGGVAGDLWVDTSSTPNKLRFFTGTTWDATSPESSLPNIAPAHALYYVRVNATGSGFEYAPLDLSSVIPVAQKGATNGVATLDASAKLPSSQLPDVISQNSISAITTGVLANGDIYLRRLFRQKIRIHSISARLNAGTCSATISVNGVTVGDTYSLSTTPIELDLVTPIEVDSLASSKLLEINITNASSSTDLDVALGVSNVGS